MGHDTQHVLSQLNLPHNITRRSANTDCTALCVRNVKRASFMLEVGAFRPKFYGNGVNPCQNVDTVPS